MGRLTHTDEQGRAAMVGVGEKATTARSARAEGRLRLAEAAYRALREHRLAKGDALSVARIAGIQAAKRTSDWIPLCHTVPLDRVAVEFELDDEDRSVTVIAMAEAHWVTGVEMEALTAVSAACLALYDMTKGIDRAGEIAEVRLLEKDGGRSGRWTRETSPGGTTS